MDLRVDIIETLRATSEDTKQKDDAIIAIISEHAPSITLAMLKNSQAFGSPSSVGSSIFIYFFVFYLICRQNFVRLL